jgi:hypothetical protein
MMRCVKTWVRVGLLSGLCCLALGTRSAHANLIPTFLSATPTAGGNTQYNYEVVVDAIQRVDGNDFFTIYDFDGFVSVVNPLPLGWTFTSNLQGVTPSGILPNDNPAVPNLTFTRNGGTLNGPSNLGVFSAVSSLNTATNGEFASQAHNVNTGGLIANRGTMLTVPSPQGQVVAAPEPSTVTLVVIGLMGVVVYVRCRRTAA